MIEFLWFLFFGFVVGVVARFLMPGRDSHGCLVTSALGIGGAMLGGYLAKFFGFHVQTYGFISSVIGAMVILLLFRLVRGNE